MIPNGQIPKYHNGPLDSSAHSRCRSDHNLALQIIKRLDCSQVLVFSAGQFACIELVLTLVVSDLLNYLIKISPEQVDNGFALRTIKQNKILLLSSYHFLYHILVFAFALIKEHLKRNPLSRFFALVSILQKLKVLVMRSLKIEDLKTSCDQKDCNLNPIILDFYL